MKLKLLDAQWNVEILPDRSEPGYDDNVLLRITEERPAQYKLLKSDQVTIGITAAEARELGRRLLEVAAREDLAGEAAGTRRSETRFSRAARIRPARQPLLFTPTQGRYLTFIHRYQARYGRSPAEADIQRHMFVSAPSVHQMLVTLERKGLIARTPGKARSIELRVPPEVLPPG